MSKWYIINSKLFLYLIFILKYPISDRDDEKLRWISYCENDYRTVPIVFQNQTNCCHQFLNNIRLQSDVGSNINKIFGSRKIQYGFWNHDQDKIVVKHLIDDNVLQRLESKLCTLNNRLCENVWNNANDEENKQILENNLAQIFNANDRIDGLQIYPNGNYYRLVVRFRELASNDLYLWFLLNINADPFLLANLHKNGFPVPAIYLTCGFVLVESYNGASLYNYYQHPFVVRAYIARQLLAAALMFTEGLNGYRIYLTDATPDNIVVDQQTYKVTFVDLDNVIMVASNATSDKGIQAAEWLETHKHEKIPCEGCFAYVPEEIAKHHRSDLNIFAICQLLNEDLYGNIDNGFLHTIPDDILVQHPKLPDTLLGCLCCDRNCDNRFNIANELLRILQRITDDTEVRR